MTGTEATPCAQMPKTIIFWQNIVSIHQTDLLEAFASRFDGRVLLAVAAKTSTQRHAMGWRPILPAGMETIISPKRDEMERLAGNSATLHIHSGFRNLGFSLDVLEMLRVRRAPYLLMGEIPSFSSSAGSLARLLYYQRFHQTAKEALGLLAIGRASAQWYRRVGFSAENIFPFAYFVHIPRFASSRSEKFRFLFVGTMSKAKGPDILLDAFARLGSRSARLQYIGDGPLRAVLQRRALALPNADISFTSYLPREEAISAMASADCVVAPSRYDGWNVVAAEALSQGTPVICGPNVGSGNLVRHHDIVLERLSSSTLAEAMANIQSLGPADEAERARRREIANSMTPAVGAEYLHAVIRSLGDAESRPLPPAALR